MAQLYQQEVLPAAVTEASTFEVDEAMEARLQQLLTSTTARNTEPDQTPTAQITRSSGVQLEWNPRMNEGAIVVRDSRTNSLN